MGKALGRSPAVYGYHAHFYYNAETFPVAEKLRETPRRGYRAELLPTA